MQVLIVEGDKDLLERWSGAFTSAGHVVSQALGIEAARKLLMMRRYDTAVTELCLFDGSGLTVGTLAKYSNPDCCVVVTTGSGMFPHGELFDIAPAVSTVLRKPVQIGELLAVTECHHERCCDHVHPSEAFKKKGDDTREEEGAAA